MTTQMPRLFGTDGIRGPFGEFPLDRETVTQLGFRLGEMLAKKPATTQMAEGESRGPRIVLGGDTRDSTAPLASWLASGFKAAGGGGIFAGVLPTPGVAYLTRSLALDGGVAISASHNRHPDNGIKLFDPRGFKWSLEDEHRLEHEIGRGVALGQPKESVDLTGDPSLGERYLLHLADALPGHRPLAGLRLALDTANGAATPFARYLFERLGAAPVTMGDTPDGRNINLDCGSTHSERLSELVCRHDCDLGIAFDGDADRALLVDENGAVQDGDTMLYLWALDLQRTGLLTPAAIVATTMSNLGLEVALARRGVETVRCDVGDRVVVETMRSRNIDLGGEQSGHIVRLDLGSTGDGMMTALHLAHLLVRQGRPLSELAAPLERFPQVLINVPVARKVAFDELPTVSRRARSIADHLGSQGRLLLRYSGTEPLARIMIEGRDQDEIETLANELGEEIRTQLGPLS